MSASTLSPSQFTTLLSQLGQAVDSPDLQNEIGEVDRVSALKVAQKLVRSLEKPREAVVKLAFSVGISV